MALVFILTIIIVPYIIKTNIRSIAYGGIDMEKIIELLLNEDMCRIDIINKYQKESFELNDYTVIEEDDCILILQGNDEFNLNKVDCVTEVSDVSVSFNIRYEDGSRVYISFPFLYAE